RAFRKAYINAFAGTGYRSMRGNEDTSKNLLFPDLAATAPQDLLDGSARLALKTHPRSTGTSSSSATPTAARNSTPSRRRSPTWPPTFASSKARRTRRSARSVTRIGVLIERFWVIVGGESGPRSRPMDPAWVTDIRDQCHRAGVAFFFKQWGGKNKKKAG